MHPTITPTTPVSRRDYRDPAATRREDRRDQRKRAPELDGEGDDKHLDPRPRRRPGAIDEYV